MDKIALKGEIASRLSGLDYIDKIIVFGSFVRSENPADIDIAVFTSNSDNYLTQAMLFRKLLRNLHTTLPLDVLPIRTGATSSFLSNEVFKGEVIYEKRS
jgi:predicted nucleotidyltransferase